MISLPNWRRIFSVHPKSEKNNYNYIPSDFENSGVLKFAPHLVGKYMKIPGSLKIPAPRTPRSRWSNVEPLPRQHHEPLYPALQCLPWAFWHFGQNTFKRIKTQVSRTCLDMFGHVWFVLQTCKINGWNLKIHPIEKENHLNQTFSFWGSILIFPGCICVLLWRATLILCFFSGHVINFFWTIEVKGMTGLHVLKRMPSIWFLSPYDYAQRPYEILSGKTICINWQCDSMKLLLAKTHQFWRFLHFSNIPPPFEPWKHFGCQPRVVPNRKM